MLRTPLYDTHVEFGARIVEFAGWEMPVQFAGVAEEHNHTRNACSVFDVSHMGRLRLTGPDCEAFLDRICTRNLTDAEVGRSYYAHVCREDGGVLDDVIVSRFESDWLVVCNGANREKIVAWLDRHRTGQRVELTDDTLATTMVAIQGPKTLELAPDVVDEDLASIKRYRCRMFQILGIPVAVFRSGYTGEDGFEVVVPAGVTQMLIPRLLGTKDKPHPVIKPAGLAARDTLRLEAGMPLYGQELTEEWDSLTGGQAWCVDLTKDFIGAEAMRKLKDNGLPRTLVGLQLEGRRIARHHYPVSCGGKQIGEVTSGTLSPTLNKSIAMALVATEHASEGTELEVGISGKPVPARVVKLPFYKRPKKTPA
ncbi:MAG: glycine cleavage system aminomethyltransferase GcvT [Phycisphaerae bacterium]